MTGALRYHPRLWIAAALGLMPYALLPHSWSTLTRVLVCWNVGVLAFLLLIYSWMRGMNAQQICSKYSEEDESGPFILVAVTVAALLSLVAIVTLLAGLKQVSGAARAAHSALAALTLLHSWLLVPTMFTTHYADMYYSASAKDRPLSFPATPNPVFGDFAYFAFTIAAACQTADVATNDVRIRRVVLMQSVVAFLFNAMILGFAINVTAGLLSGG